MSEIEAFEYDGAGYTPAMRFGAWRVAIANFGAHSDRAQYNYRERLRKYSRGIIRTANDSGYLVAYHPPVSRKKTG